MNQARGLITLATLVVVGVQLAVFTEWRFAGAVVMLVWLWPLAVGLTGLTSLALFAGLLSGVLFDAQSATPFGLSALVGLALAYFASRMGKEGVGDLDSAAFWVTPALAAVGGFAAPRGLRAQLLTVAWKPPRLDADQRRRVRYFGTSRDAGGLRPEHQRNESTAVKGSWRDRPTSSWFHRMWRPWVSLNPFRGRGRHINEPRPVGIRNLVASPEEVRVRPERRWRIIGGFFSLLLILLVVRLFMLQIVEHNASVATVNSNSLHTATIPAPRGLIVDRTGAPLVTNVTTTEILLSRAQALLDPSVIGALASLTSQSVKQIQSDLTNVQYSVYQPAPVMSDAPTSIVQFIKLHPGEFPGVSVQGVAQRSYPFGGSTASQVLGYVGPITGAEISANPTAGYTTNSTYGKTGIENFYEQYLRGTAGTSTIEVSAQGNIIGSVEKTPPKQGDSVVLNVDARLQKALDTYLANDVQSVRHTVDATTGVIPPAPNGAAIVMDVTNGDVLAMSSYPSFNLSSFVNGLSETTFKGLLNEGAFTNYPIQGQYTPGSTFKMVSATAELQTGIFPADETVDDTGTFTVPGCFHAGGAGCVFHDDQGQGAGLVDLPSALTVSSDYYFYNLGYLFWSQQAKYGETPIQNAAHQYGLDQYSNIDLPNEVQGRVDSPTVRLALHKAAPKAFPNVTWYTGDNIEMAFGQGSTAVTPIGLADAYATFATSPKSRRRSSAPLANSSFVTERGCSDTSACLWACATPSSLVSRVWSRTPVARRTGPSSITPRSQNPCFRWRARPVRPPPARAPTGQNSSPTRGLWASPQRTIRNTSCCAWWPRGDTALTRPPRSWPRPLITSTTTPLSPWFSRPRPR